MNISLQRMIWDQLTDTHVPGTNGHTGIGPRTLTTSGAGFPVRDHLPAGVSLASCCVINKIFWLYDTKVVIGHVFIYNF